MTRTTWNIDTAHSGLGFTVRHMVFARVRGRFGQFSGTLHLDQDDLTRSEVKVEIEATSIDTGVADRDAHLRSPDFLDVERFPKLAFASRRIERIGDDQYRVHGALTLHGVTREIALDVDYAGQTRDPWGHQRAAFTATASLDRTDFGLEWNQVLETGGVLVGKRIDVELELQAVQASASQAA